MEIWKSVVNYIGVYEVSDLGNVRRLPSLRVLTPRNCSNGYKMVHFRDKGRDQQKMVHAAVAEAFIGPRPEGHVVSHKDHIKFHNWLGNLEYITYAENNKKSAIKGEAHPTHKYSDYDIGLMRQMKTMGVSAINIAHKFGCSQGHLSGILSGRLRQVGV